MEFVKKAKGYSDKEEEEEDEEEEEEVRNLACDFFPHRQMQWLENSHQSQDHETSRSYSHQPLTTPSEAINFHGKLQLMDLTLRIDSNGSDGGGGGGGGSSSGNGFMEREHMFDKVVTPSDVGKLNRLVIPKQHAEKYFPLDSSTNEKGLILNFEDRNGKPWRFRYSYWNSSQSYVMTKGWSRFVKEKKLDAGDIVSFERGVGDLGKDRLYIDWRRRPDAPRPNQFSNLHQVPNPLLLLPQSVRWGGRHYTVPPSMAVPSPRRTHHHHHLQHMNYSSLYPNYSFEMPNLGTSNSLYYLRPSMSSPSYRMGTMQQAAGENQASSMVINSVPLIYNGNKTSSGATTATAAKRLRLFGVNMECPATATATGTETVEEDLPNGGVPLATAIEAHQFPRRGKEPLSLNWDT